MDEPIQMVGSPEIAAQDPTFFNSLRLASFTVISLGTTTGYCTADFDYFPELALCILMVLAFIGGCAGSTAGGMKVVRAVIGLKVLQSTIEREHRPSVVRSLKMGRNSIDAGIKIEVLSILLVSLFFLALSTALVQIIEGPDLDLTTALSESFSCLFNIGPGVASAGASETYAWMQPAHEMGAGQHDAAGSSGVLHGAGALHPALLEGRVVRRGGDHIGLSSMVLS